MLVLEPNEIAGSHKPVFSKKTGLLAATSNCQGTSNEQRNDFKSKRLN